MLTMPFVTILQFLGDSKAIVLISGYATIPTSNSAGDYYTIVNLPKPIILLSFCHAYGLYRYPEIADTTEKVYYRGSPYGIQARLGLPIDAIELRIYQTDNVPRNVIRNYFVMGVMDL